MNTFTEKGLQQILDDVPEGKIYVIDLVDGDSIKQRHIWCDSFRYSQTEYTHKKEIIKVKVHRGFIELHEERKDMTNKKVTSKKVTIKFIPFFQIKMISYVDYVDEE